MSTVPGLAMQYAIATSLGTDVVSSTLLIDRIMAHGYHYRGHVYRAVSIALRCGMVQRVSEGLARQYRLNPDWHLDPVAVAAARAQHARSCAKTVAKATSASAPAISPSYEGPAFDRDPLTPSVGTVCGSQEELEGELPPYLGGRMVDSLHNHFARIFGEVE